jgi:cytochrome c peroxidase
MKNLFARQAILKLLRWSVPLLAIAGLCLIAWSFLTHPQFSREEAMLDALLSQAGVSPLDLGPTPSRAQVDLGKALFFDKILSGNRDTACATCHHPLLHTGDGLSLSLGTGGVGLGPARQPAEGQALIPRNAPDVFNRGAPEWRNVFWDGRVSGDTVNGFVSPAGAALPIGLDNIVAVQALFPPTSRDEMRGKAGDVDMLGHPNELAAIDDGDFTAIWDALLARVLALSEYRALFAAAYPDVSTGQITIAHVANALAAYQVATFSADDSPWNRYLAGEEAALAPEARQGALLFFGEAGCAGCHNGPLLTDQAFHNIAVPQLGPGKLNEMGLDFGRYLETGEEADRFAFRTPSLHNVAITGPWMHNGAYVHLEDAVRHHLDPVAALRSYDASQLSPLVRVTYREDSTVIASLLRTMDLQVRPARAFSDTEIQQLLAFLHALTAPSLIDQSRDIPASVPSGLPVD